MFDSEQVLEEFIEASYLPANYRKGSLNNYDLAIDSNGEIVRVYIKDIEKFLNNLYRDN